MTNNTKENDVPETLYEPEFPILILDADGVVDRVRNEDEAKAYIAETPDLGLRWERDVDDREQT